MTGTTLTNGAADPGAAPPPSSSLEPSREAPKFVVTDERSAGEAIAGLLFGAGEDDAPQPGDTTPSRGEPPPDTGAPETTPTGDDDDRGSGEPQPSAAAIEPPTSWSDQDKQTFSQLPPDVQRTIARRESQREAALTQRSQEAAEMRRAAEAAQSTAVAQRQAYLSDLQKMFALAAPEYQQLQNIDWVATQAQSPAEYTRLLAKREELQNRLGAIDQEYNRVQYQLQQEGEQQVRAYVEDQRKHLVTAWPDYGDETKAPALRRDLGLYLRDSGQFSPDEINKAYDHRLVVLATKAMLYDRMNAARASAEAKRSNPVPQVAPPGNSQASDRGPDARLRARVNALGRTNGVREAGSLIAELL